jgi:hypothetical protein
MPRRPNNAADKATKFRNFEELGVAGVRLRLERNTYNAEWHSAALEWLGMKEKEERRQAAAAQLEQTRIARDTAKATWAGVRATWAGAIVSGIGAIVAIVAAAVSILAALRR